jgi:5'-nucleotidase
MAVDGTPTDCVHLALNGLLTDEPDMVVCGINNGANMGDDVHYSGTVAGAMEGRFLGYPAVAISLASYQAEHLSTAARVARVLVERLRGDSLPRDTLLNVNVPDLPWAALAGWQATRLGNRHKSEPIITDTDPRGDTCYWVGPPGAEQDAGPGTDFYAVANGYVSVTPLHVDLTRYDTLTDLNGWLQQCSKD